MQEARSQFAGVSGSIGAGRTWEQGHHCLCAEKGQDVCMSWSGPCGGPEDGKDSTAV